MSGMSMKANRLQQTARPDNSWKGTEQVILNHPMKQVYFCNRRQLYDAASLWLSWHFSAMRI